MRVHAGQNLPRVVVKNQGQQILQRCAVRRLGPEQRGGTFAPCGLFWYGVDAEPVALAQNFQHVGGSEFVFGGLRM
jgi:hypothetical protein